MNGYFEFLLNNRWKTIIVIIIIVIIILCVDLIGSVLLCLHW